MPANVIGVLEGVQSAAITVRQERCAMVRNRNADCLRCADACTSGCISLVDGLLSIDLSKCVGCGTCATACPTCALESHNPSDSVLLNSALENARDGIAVVACHPICGIAQPQGGNSTGSSVATALVDGPCGKPSDVASMTEVVCLGRVDESLICALAAAGIQQVHLKCGDCERCEQRRGFASARVVVDSANALLEAWGSSARATIEQELVPLQLRNEPIVHRGSRANSDSSASGIDAMSEIFDTAPGDECPGPSSASRLPRVMRDGTLPHFLPVRRERLLDSLVQMGNPVAPSISTRLWGMVSIDERACVSCRMCSTFCPTGAIVRFDDPDGAMGVEHYPGDCVKCGTCRAICPAGAIEIRDEVSPACLLDGEVHRYEMRPREVEFGPHQILQTMSRLVDGDLFER